MSSHSSSPSRARSSEVKGKAKEDDGFDPRSFRQVVNDADVSDETIAKLQKRWGNDLSAALDYYFDKGDGSDVIDVSDDPGPSLVAERNKGPVKLEEIIVRNQYWDRRKGAYVLKKPAKSSLVPSDHVPCVLLVIRCFSERGIYVKTIVHVQGAFVRRALINIFRDVPALGLTETGTELSKPEYLYWSQPELEMLAAHYEASNDDTTALEGALFEIKSALKFIKKQWQHSSLLLRSLLPRSISFELLWAIFPPYCLVVVNHQLGFEMICRAGSHSVERDSSGLLSFNLQMDHIEWDGTIIGRAPGPSLRIPEFTGSMAVEKLPAIPLQRHPRRHMVVKNILARSERKLSFCMKEYQLQTYVGRGLRRDGGIFEGGSRLVSFIPRGRVMVDPKMMTTQHTAEVIEGAKSMPSELADALDEDAEGIVPVLEPLEPQPAINTRLSELTWLTGKMQDDQKGCCHSSNDVLTGLLMLTEEPRMADEDSNKQDKIGKPDNSKSGSRKPHSLSLIQRLLLSGLIYGYNFGTDTWGAFFVGYASEVEWNDKLLDSLVMEESLRSTLYKLVKVHSLGLQEFDDFVKGKGKGIIGLLHGPPGSGKTLTAEAIAETGHMPLYMVSSGALGHEPDTVYKRLMAMLRLATHWKALLLLDEADVFLAKRSLTQLMQNTITSVFLRALEYFEGILILTTNQIDKIDEAFLSRTHFCHQYTALDVGARRQVWKNFLQEISKSNVVDVTIGEAELNKLALLNLNGREIKNTLGIAISLTHPDVGTADRSSSAQSTSRMSRRVLKVDNIIHVVKTLREYPRPSENHPAERDFMHEDESSPSRSRTLGSKGNVRPTSVVQIPSSTGIRKGPQPPTKPKELSPSPKPSHSWASPSEERHIKK